jgi:hypothetical protein
VARTHGAAHGELIAELGLAGYLSCVAIAVGERSAGRLVVSRPRAERVRALLSSLGIATSIASFEYQPRGSGPAAVHEGGFVATGCHPDALSVIYAGCDAALCAAAEVAELHGDHRGAGAMFGYPTCCIDSYEAARTRSGREDITVQGLPDAGPFPAELNPLLRHLFGYRLVFHLPCTARCPPSLARARQVIERLSRATPAARELGQMGKGLGLYGPRIGAALVSELEQVAPGRFRARRALVSGSYGSALLAEGRESEIRVHSVRSFEVGPVTFEDDEHFAAFFT